MPALQEEAAKNSSEQGGGVTRVGSYLYLILSVQDVSPGVVWGRITSVAVCSKGVLDLLPLYSVLSASGAVGREEWQRGDVA
jgi:hypothetical protein